jgi:tellurite resistance protein TerC
VTPLAIVLIMVETTDLIFAVDSIPAVFAITRDPFIVYTSSVFAILGLRALYFLLAGVVRQFVYLKAGLSTVLIWVGAKMLLSDVYDVSTVVSLGVVAAVLAVAIAASLIRTKTLTRREPTVEGAVVQVTGGKTRHE